MNNTPLLIASKCPWEVSDKDGGSILVEELISVFTRLNKPLDALLLRHKNDHLSIPSPIRKTMYCSPPSINDKFRSRLEAGPGVMKALSRMSPLGRPLIITHISNAFFLCEGNKLGYGPVILFPMFTSTSYTLSGERVPAAYIDMERRSLEHVDTIVTPSKFEARQLVHDFGVSPEKITVLPRSFDKVPALEQRTFKGRDLFIICIGAVRKQKNQIAAIPVIRELLRCGLNPIFNFAGYIQDDNYYSEILDQVSIYGLQSNVCFHGSLERNKLHAVLEQSHCTVSFSRCETFGRGIFEALTAGRPTVVYKDLEATWEYLQGVEGMLIGAERDPCTVAQELLTLTKMWLDKPVDTTRKSILLDAKSGIDALFGFLHRFLTPNVADYHGSSIESGRI